MLSSVFTKSYNRKEVYSMKIGFISIFGEEVTMRVEQCDSCDCDNTSSGGCDSDSGDGCDTAQ